MHPSNNTPKNKAKGVAAPIASDKILNLNNTSSNNQRAIILEALRQIPKTIVQLRHELGIMQPAPRILELKAQGHNNKTLRVVTCTPDSVKNSAVAKYVLRGENHDNDWLQHLQTLVARFSHLGIDADIAALSLCELWALYCYLSRLAGD